MIELGHEAGHTMSFIDSCILQVFIGFFSGTSRENFIVLLREETTNATHNKMTLCVSCFVKFYVTHSGFIPLFP
jgi:hypothetical protein